MSREKIERNRKLYLAYKSNPDSDYALLGRAFGISRQAVRNIIRRIESKGVILSESEVLTTTKTDTH